MKAGSVLWSSGSLLLATTGWAQTTSSHADEQAARVFCGACAGFAFAIPLLYIAAVIGIAVWIYKDATRRGDPQAAIWALIGFLFNVVGLIIYIVVRNRNATLPPSGPPYVPPAPPV